MANNKVGNQSEVQFRNHVNRAISSGKEKGELAQPKGVYTSALRVLGPHSS
jgi:histone H1/5